MTHPSIEVVNLSKCFKIYAHPLDRIIDWISPFESRHYREFWALRSLSFSVPKGDAVGIIGANGAGKSTLLKIISGTSRQTNGYVKVEGKIAALLELGLGFHFELTGRQNILLNGKLLGLSGEELRKKLPEIIAFSELGDFIDQPLRTYSTGMYVRLGFSVVASVEPDILIVDEALNVGDAHFQQKCIRRIREIHENGTTLLFVSHDPGAVRSLCQEAFLLDEGEIVSRGGPDEILDHYNALVARKSIRETVFHIERVPSPQRHRAVRHSGNFMAVITDAGIQNEQGEKITAVVSGQRAVIYVKVFFLGEVDNPTIGFLVKDRLGNEIFGTNTYMLKKSPGACHAGESLEVRFSFPLNFGSGEYTLTAAAHTLDYHIYECYDWADKIFSFTVIPSLDFKFTGVVKRYPDVAHTKEKTSDDQARSLIEYIFQDAPSELHMGPAFQKFLCKGWYEGETGGDDYIRWTDKEFAFFLKVAGRRMFFDAACTRPDIATVPLSMAVSSQGTPVAQLRVNSADFQTLYFSLPDILVGRIVLFTVKIDRSWKPSEHLNTPDDRDLGILIRRIGTDQGIV